MNIETSIQLLEESLEDSILQEMVYPTNKTPAERAYKYLKRLIALNGLMVKHMNPENLIPFMGATIQSSPVTSPMDIRIVKQYASFTNPKVFTKLLKDLDSTKEALDHEDPIFYTNLKRIAVNSLSGRKTHKLLSHGIMTKKAYGMLKGSGDSLRKGGEMESLRAIVGMEKLMKDAPRITPRSKRFM